jgi:hypothetical protein
MKPSEQRLNETHRQRTEAIVARHMDELFRRLPMLSGFWLRPDLEVAELAVHLAGLRPGPGAVRGSDAVARRSRREASGGGAAHTRAHLRPGGPLMPCTRRPAPGEARGDRGSPSRQGR